MFYKLSKSLKIIKWQPRFFKEVANIRHRRLIFEFAEVFLDQGQILLERLF